MDYLKVNENALFLVTIQDKIQNDQIKYYTLIAEYAVVTEFPIGVLVVTLSAYIGITRCSSNIITNLIFATNLK